MPRSKRVEVWTGFRLLPLPVGPPVPVVDANGNPVLTEGGEPLYRFNIGPTKLKFLRQVGDYAPGPNDVAELWAGINLILLFANDHRADGESRDGAIQWSPYFENAAHEGHVAREVHQNLTLLSEGAKEYEWRAWPASWLPYFRNLVALIAKRVGYYVRCCPMCQCWFLATDERRRKCYRDPCDKSDARGRASKSRQTPGAQRQRELGRRPRVTRKGTREDE